MPSQDCHTPCQTAMCSQLVHLCRLPLPEQMLDYKRPGVGLNPDQNKLIIGSKAKRNIKFDEIINLEDF